MIAYEGYIGILIEFAIDIGILLRKLQNHGTQSCTIMRTQLRWLRPFRGNHYGICIYPKG